MDGSLARAYFILATETTNSSRLLPDFVKILFHSQRLEPSEAIGAVATHPLCYAFGLRASEHRGWMI